MTGCYTSSNNLTTAEKLLDKTYDIWGMWEALPMWSDDITVTREYFFNQADITKQWLSSLPPNTPFMVSMLHDYNEDVVGVALFGVTRLSLKGPLSIPALTLNRSGKEDLDQFWPEYVSPRIHKQHRNAIATWFDHILLSTRYSAIITQVIPSSWLDAWQGETEVVYAIKEQQERGGVAFLDQMGKLSSSLKRNINQTQRYAKENLGGELVLSELHGEHKKVALHHAAQWHREKWRDTDTPSGFDNPTFMALWEALCEKGGSAVHVYSAQAGDVTVGISVSLRDADWEGFYLAGYLPKKSNHWHPGIWMHTKIMERLQQQGVAVYDFMAGDAKYKVRLSHLQPLYCRGVWVRNRGLVGKTLKKWLEWQNKA